jgi:hypothetical protein
MRWKFRPLSFASLAVGDSSQSEFAGCVKNFSGILVGNRQVQVLEHDF